MTPSSGPAKRQLVITLVALAVVIILVIVLLRSDYFVAGWIVLGALVAFSSFWTIAISYPVYAIRNANREAALAVSDPQATLVTIVVPRKLAKRFRAISIELGMPRSKVRGSSYVTLSIDAQQLRAFGGGGKPKQLLSLPTSAVTAVELGSTMAGQKVAPTLELTVATAPPQIVELVPMVTPKVVGKAMPKDLAAAKVDAVRALLG